MAKKLIINADDYGMSASINRGIIKAVLAGSVKSTTVMTNGHDFHESMDELFKCAPTVDIGFHSTLTWGQPISDPETIKSLVDEQGMFLSRSKLLLKSLMGRVSEEDAYKELSAQIALLKKRASKVTHIDGHHHVHVFPSICRAVMRVARENGIEFIRAPFEGSWSSLMHMNIRRLTVMILPASKPDFWRDLGFQTPDNFGGFSLAAGKSLPKRWLSTFAAIPDGVTEIMVHPGHFSLHNDSYNMEREQEIKILSDPSFAEMAKKMNVELSSFAEI